MVKIPEADLGDRSYKICQIHQLNFSNTPAWCNPLDGKSQSHTSCTHHYIHTDRKETSINWRGKFSREFFSSRSQSCKSTGVMYYTDTWRGQAQIILHAMIGLNFMFICLFLVMYNLMVNVILIHGLCHGNNVATTTHIDHEVDMWVMQQENQTSLNSTSPIQVYTTFHYYHMYNAMLIVSWQLYVFSIHCHSCNNYMTQFKYIATNSISLNLSLYDM